jgi:hypothetical protein
LCGIARKGESEPLFCGEHLTQERQAIFVRNLLPVMAQLIECCALPAGTSLPKPGLDHGGIGGEVACETLVVQVGAAFRETAEGISARCALVVINSLALSDNYTFFIVPDWEGQNPRL